MLARFRGVLFTATYQIRVATAAVLVLTFANNASAEYLLSPGDVLEITAVGLPDLKLTATINADGQAAFPLLGQLKAAGIPLSELRDKVRELLPTKVFRRRTMDGREYPVVVTPDEVTLVVAEYRPVYLDGDVAKPGAQPYRPGMNVRQAIALAGGYDVMRFRGKDPFLEAADFRAQYYSLWTEFAKEQAHITRLKAELADNNKLDREGFIKTPIDSSVAARIEDLEAQQLKAAISDHQNEKAHLRQAMAQEDHRIAVLSETEEKEREGAQADARDLDEMKQNFKKGMIPIMRMSETRRLSLLSATQALQTTALLASVEREREELNRKMQKQDDQRQIELMKELQNAEVRLETIRSQIQAVGDKLMYTGLVRSQLVRGHGNPPDVKIFRDTRDSRQTLKANEDTELMPGDVVEVALRMEELASSAQR